MKIIVAGTKDQNTEWMPTINKDADLVWTENYKDFYGHKGADAFIDLTYKRDEVRTSFLSGLLPSLVMINSVDHTLRETNPAFIRINAWPTFLASSLVEGAGNVQSRKPAENILSFLGKQLQWVPDEPGFVTPRIISMIINEAFLSLEEGVSTEEEIDTAMKLGTNYPYGPFEWAEKIGRENIRNLLMKLALRNPRYNPSSLL